MIQRGIEDYDAAKSFFRPELSDLHDPFLMLGMKKAVDRIFQAIDKGENGKRDIWHVDTNYDGKPDASGIDTNGDGKPDKFKKIS